AGPALRASRAQPAKHQLVARDHKTGALLHPGGRIVQHASRHLGHTPARVAAHVLVVLLADLVVRLPIPYVDAPDRALTLHRRHSTKHARIVRRTKLPTDS